MEDRNLSKSKRFIATLFTAFIGGALFTLLHIPVPWLLGPMVAVLLGTNIWKRHYVWPNGIRDSGMMIVGYTIGLSMTPVALHAMALQLPSMLVMTVLLILFCSGIAFVVSKFSSSDYSTSLLGSIPGGLTQVILLAEETKGINLAVVTVTQVIRLMMIIIFIPLLVTLPLFRNGGAADMAADVADQATASWSGLFPDILLFAVVGIALAFLGSKIRFPTAVLLGPAVGTAVLQAFGMEGPNLPPVVISLSQLMIGTHVGLMLQVNQIQQKVRTIGLAVGSGLMLLIGSIVLGMVLTKIQPVTHATSLLSLAPGGMDQMGIIAHEIHADLSMVSGYQLFRTFFIYFAVPPLVKVIFRQINKKKLIEQREHG
ncbi:AbrB family transcriptional regulator [Lentibacillus sp. N15]|uniref:AbrB family transcriptional regulator n=1 Tax=Lentibacillus songyuanensis TaxID=3136161 RepID=UPI0031BB5923